MHKYALEKGAFYCRPPLTVTAQSSMQVNVGSSQAIQMCSRLTWRCLILSLSIMQLGKCCNAVLPVQVRGKDNPKPVKTWTQCGLDRRALAVLEKQKYTKPMPIQAQALPAIMSGRDCIGIAKTGSGKTLAFVLPMLRHIRDQVSTYPLSCLASTLASLVFLYTSGQAFACCSVILMSHGVLHIYHSDQGLRAPLSGFLFSVQPPLATGDGPIGLIMAPTRELVVQIGKDIRLFSRALDITCVCAYGGSAVGDQISALKRGAEVSPPNFLLTNF